MMPPPPPEQLTRVVNVRLTQSAHAELGAAAAAAGMTLSAYCRRRMLGHAVIPSTDAANLRELRRLGGLLKLAHTQSAGAYTEDTAKALKVLSAAIGRIAPGT